MHDKLVAYWVDSTVANTFPDTLLTRDPIGTPIVERIRNHIPADSHQLLSGRVQLIK